MKPTRIILVIAALAASSAVFADGSKPDPHPGDISVGAAAEAMSLSSSNSFGGDNSLTTDNDQTHTERNTYVGLSMHSPTPAPVIDCWRPKGKLGRGFRALFGAWEMSATVVLDKDCVAAQAAADDRQTEQIRAETERLDAELALETVRAENELAIERERTAQLRLELELELAK